MSKCDIHIVFDQPERKFRSGESVTGKVIVGVNKDVKCRGIVISGYWKTHGRGNRDQGEYDQKNVFSGDMRAGESYEFPFEITAPHSPLTYRGKLINIDHYVRARVDIPWAFDPKQEDEFILLPSPKVQAPTQPYSAEHASSKPSTKIAGYVVFAIIIAIVFLVFLPRGGFVLLMLPVAFVILALVAFFGLRKTMAERRLGKVDLSLENAIVAPGQSIPITLSFTPRKRGSIRGVTAGLTGKERAVSGSGTDKTTHRHTIHEHKVTLDGPTEFAANKRVEFSGVVQIPDTNAYSFDVGENEVAWTLDLRIDIPLWPDWVDSTKLQLVPAEHFGGQSNESMQADVIDAQVISTMKKEAVLQPSQPEPPQPTATATFQPESRAVAQPSGSSPTLLEAVGLLSQLDRYSDDRDRILGALKHDTFEISVEVQRIVSSYERFEDSSFDGGKTISGVISGTNHAVQISMPRAANDELNSLHSGDIWQGRGRVAQWDSLYGRLEVLGDY